MRRLLNHRSHSPGARRIAALLLGLALAAGEWSQAAGPRLSGIPFTRTYSLDKIGVSRGARLGFDRIGRLAVISGRDYVALNDAVWVNISAAEPGSPALIGVANGADGRATSAASHPGASWNMRSTAFCARARTARTTVRNG